MIHFITGGERSGKSSYAQKAALELSENPVYLATAKVWDDDFEKRIRRHQRERDDRWELIEEEISPSSKFSIGRTIVIDCMTLWLTNMFKENDQDLDKSVDLAKSEITSWKEFDANLIVVSNELGMGLHASSKMGRDFVSLQGWSNQAAASIATKVTFMVSGIPLTVK